MFWLPDVKNWPIGKDTDAGKDWRQEEKGTTEDEMVGWHHRLDGHEFEQVLGVGDEQESLACCSPWGCKESDMTEQLIWTEAATDQAVLPQTRPTLTTLTTAMGEHALRACLSLFSHVQLCATAQMAAHQAPLSLGFSRQDYWSGLPFPSPMHESEKWKWSHSVMSDSSWPHGLQPTRLLHPWDFPGKSTGVVCHHLLPESLGSKHIYQVLHLTLTSRNLIFLWTRKAAFLEQSDTLGRAMD